MQPKNKIVRIGVGAIWVNQYDEVLLLRRMKAPEKGKWTLPGGAIEWGEKAEEAVLRECLEEIGVVCNIITFLGYYDYIQHEQSHWVSMFYVIESANGQLPVNMEKDKHSDMVWMKMDSLTDLTENTIFALKLYGIWKNGNH